MSVLPQELIRTKRDGGELSDGDVEAFVRGLVDGGVGEGQAAAFAMAVLWRGLSRAECAALTRAMARSGATLSWDLPGPVLDKHSTGGVGDTVSLILAPAVAACGGYVPMISGRGLGHTGGTLDKLDAIPGYRSQPDIDEFRRVVRETGFAIIGQTADLAPADRHLYAIRDVTGTVESVDLITASILSKKLAAGLDALVMDVKRGSGAFMTTDEDARALARRIVDVSGAAGLPTVALVTDMDEPLASSAGNALEVAHAIDHLTGRRRETRLHAVTVALGAAMLVAGRLASDEAEGAKRIEAAFASGAAAERFARSAVALGGPSDLLEGHHRHLRRAPHVRAVPPERPGVVVGIATRAVGLAVVGLGGGRTRAADPIDHAVGITDLAGLNDPVGPDRPLGVVHARSEAHLESAARTLREAYRIDDRPVNRPAPVHERIGPA